MTEDEKRDLNRRVAVALGWEVKQGVTGWRWFRGSIPASYTWPTRGAAERHVPDFCADPAAADIVKARMKERGWHYKSGVMGSGAFAQVDTREPLYLMREALGQDTEEMALCLAFLAACEAAKKAEEGGEG